MTGNWKVEIEEELDCETLAVYANGVEVGRYMIVEDPQAERRDLVNMIQACVMAARVTSKKVVAVGRATSRRPKVTFRATGRGKRESDE